MSSIKFYINSILEYIRLSFYLNIKLYSSEFIKNIPSILSFKVSNWDIFFIFKIPSFVSLGFILYSNSTSLTNIPKFTLLNITSISLLDLFSIDTVNSALLSTISTLLVLITQYSFSINIALSNFLLLSFAILFDTSISLVSIFYSLHTTSKLNIINRQGSINLLFINLILL